MMVEEAGRLKLPPAPNWTAEEVRCLIKQAQTGDVAARNSLIEGNLRLAMSIAGRFRGRADFEDIFQAACLGLMKAIDRFDLSYDVMFSTYAVPLIIGEVRQFLRDLDPMRISRRVKEKAASVMAAEEELEQSLGRSPTLGELQERLSIPREEILESLEAVAPVASLQDIITHGDDSMTLEEKIGQTPETDLWVDNFALRQICHRLASKDRQIVQMRFFEEKTQSDVAQELGLSQSHISRRERQILELMRQWLAE